MNAPPFAVKRTRRRLREFVIAVAILLGGLYVIGTASNHFDGAPNVSSYSTSDGYPAHSITASGFRMQTIGTTLTDVKAVLGDPEDAQQHAYGNGTGGTSSSTCIYYNDLAGNTGVYQFCFDNGTLTSKAKY